MPCVCKPACQGDCPLLLKTAMFSQPGKQQTPQSQTVDSTFAMVQHLEKLFREHKAAEILASGFNDTLVSIPPLLLVSSVGYNFGLIRLLEAGANVDLQNPKDGNTSLILATRGKYAETMKILLKYNANLTIVNQDGNNAFMVAVTTGSPVLVNLLWQYRNSFDINCRNKKGYSALLLSAEKCWESCINMLLIGGSSKNLLSEHGDSALAIATRANDKKSVQTLLEANVKRITENKSGDTPICIAILEGKGEMFDLIINRMAPTERLVYVNRKLDLLKRKTLADCRKFDGYSSDEDFYLNSLFPVIRKLIWHEAFRRYFQLKSFPVAMIGVVCRHMSNDELIQRAAQLLTMIMHDQRHLDRLVVEEFLQKQCPDILIKSLQFYSSTTKHRQSITIVSLLLPVIFACTHVKGIEWLRTSWSNVISYVQVFEKGYLQLHYEENRDMTERVWRLFKEKFQIIQKEKADIACAELLKTEAEEKAKLEKRERKRTKRLKKKLLDCEMSNNNAAPESSESQTLTLKTDSLSARESTTTLNPAPRRNKSLPLGTVASLLKQKGINEGDPDSGQAAAFAVPNEKKVIHRGVESVTSVPLFQIQSIRTVSSYTAEPTTPVTKVSPHAALASKHESPKTCLDEVARIFAKACRMDRPREGSTASKPSVSESPLTTSSEHKENKKGSTAASSASVETKDNVAATVMTCSAMIDEGTNRLTIKTKKESTIPLKKLPKKGFLTSVTTTPSLSTSVTPTLSLSTSATPTPSLSMSVPITPPTGLPASVSSTPSKDFSTSVILTPSLSTSVTPTPSNGLSASVSFTPSKGFSTSVTSVPSKGLSTIVTSTPPKGFSTNVTLTPSKGLSTIVTSTPPKGFSTNVTSTPSKGLPTSVTYTPSKQPANEPPHEKVRLPLSNRLLLNTSSSAPPPTNLNQEMDSEPESTSNANSNPTRLSCLEAVVKQKPESQTKTSKKIVSEKLEENSAMVDENPSRTGNATVVADPEHSGAQNNTEEFFADAADDEEDVEDETKQVKAKKKRRRRRKGKGKAETEETTETVVPAEPQNEPESVVEITKEQAKGQDAAANTFEPVVSRRSLKQLKKSCKKKLRQHRSPTPYCKKEDTHDTDSIKSYHSSKSASPMANRTHSLEKGSETNVKETEIIPPLLKPDGDSSSSKTNPDSRTTNASSSQPVKPPQKDNTSSTPVAESADAPSTPPPATEVVSDEPDTVSKNAAAEVSVSSPSMPQSWADLLKHKDLEFPKLGAKIPANALISWPNDVKKPSANDSCVGSGTAIRKEKECFTLSEFILPDVARKINSCDGTGPEPSSPASKNNTSDGAGLEPPSSDNKANTLNGTEPESSSPDNKISEPSSSDTIPYKEPCETTRDTLSERLGAAVTDIPHAESESTAHTSPVETCLTREEQLEKEDTTPAPPRNSPSLTDDEEIQELSPPVLNDAVPSGEHVVTPKPVATAVPMHPSNKVNRLLVSPSSTLFSGSCLPPSFQSFLRGSEALLDDSCQGLYFKDEECTIDTEAASVIIPDPKYTNYLTDIRTFDITPDPLHDVGFLSNDSSEDEAETKFAIPTVSNKQQRHNKVPIPHQHRTSYGQTGGKYDEGNSGKQMTWDMMTTFYHYQSTLLMQQQRPAGNSNTGQAVPAVWMPYNMVIRNQQSNNPQGYRSTMLRSNITQVQCYQQYSPTFASRWYNQQKPAISSPNTQYQLASKLQLGQQENSGAVQPWKDTTPTRRHEGLICQFQEMPKERLVMKGNILLCIENNFLIGKSVRHSSEVVVLLGMIGKMPVAVKRLPIALYTPLKETVHRLLLPKYQQHEHLVRYLEVAEDDHYGYIAQELCDYTVEEFLPLVPKRKATASLHEALYKLVWQLLKGVQTLHCRCLMLHRNLKPTNILIDSYGKLKLSDYGLTQVTSEGMTLFHNSNAADNCWRPRECSMNSQNWIGQLSMTHYTMHSDIQVAGMLVYFVLTGGEHQFGDNAFDIEVNIAGGWPKMKELNSEVNHLLWLMLAKEPRDRPDISTVLRHPYFWSEKRRFEFLVTVGSEVLNLFSPISMSKVSSTVDKLNCITFNSGSTDWANQLNNGKLLDEMEIDCRSAKTVCDLLVFLHDVQQNYSRLSIHVRSQMGQHLHHYFLSRFPGIFIPVYKIIKSSDWSNKPSLKLYLQ